jgi:hypothetical protein
MNIKRLRNLAFAAMIIAGFAASREASLRGDGFDNACQKCVEDGGTGHCEPAGLNEVGSNNCQDGGGVACKLNEPPCFGELN